MQVNRKIPSLLHISSLTTLQIMKNADCPKIYVWSKKVDFLDQIREMRSNRSDNFHETAALFIMIILIYSLFSSSSLSYLRMFFCFCVVILINAQKYVFEIYSSKKWKSNTYQGTCSEMNRVIMDFSQDFNVATKRCALFTLFFTFFCQKLSNFRQ